MGPCWNCGRDEEAVCIRCCREIAADEASLAVLRLAAAIARALDTHTKESGGQPPEKEG